MAQLSHPCMTTGKTTALTIQTFIGKVNMAEPNSNSGKPGSQAHALTTTRSLTGSLISVIDIF